MKRAWTGFLFTVLCVSVFFGYANATSPIDDSQSTRNGVNTGAASVEITIAEATPSGTAFEYREGKPYCFYGYDGDGALYRILWNRFDGWKEKECIVGEYGGGVRALTYEEYSDGQMDTAI